MDNFESHPLGSILRENKFTAFFGNRESSTEKFRQAFPEWKFFRLKQIHSDFVFFADPQSPDLTWQGDASFTFHRKLALCSITADCMPVLIYSEESQQVAAIHAGWRGIASRIIPKTFEKMKDKGVAADNSYRFLIGPHIMKPSFEVENKVRDEILASIGIGFGDPKAYYQEIDQQKSLVDLLAVAQKQIREIAPYAPIITHVKDTKTDSSYNSYRRDKGSHGRQVSFICLN